MHYLAYPRRRSVRHYKLAYANGEGLKRGSHYTPKCQKWSQGRTSSQPYIGFSCQWSSGILRCVIRQQFVDVSEKCSSIIRVKISRPWSRVVYALDELGVMCISKSLKTGQASNTWNGTYTHTNSTPIYNIRDWCCHLVTN
jgi:hypothetical protein